MADTLEEVTQEKPQLDENKQQILEYVIKNASFGETAEILVELKKLVADYDLYKEFIDGLLVKHAQDHFAIVPASSDLASASLLLTPVNYLDGYYIDQTHNKKLSVDHANLTLTSAEDIILPTNPVLNQYREYIEKGISEYMSNYYSGTQYGHIVYLDWDQENFTIYVALTCKNLKLNSYQQHKENHTLFFKIFDSGGEWISDWKIDAQTITGKVRVNSHFFEDGNVCLKEVKKFTDSVQFSGQEIESEAKKIVQQIIAAEQAIQLSLEDIYERMSDTFFKNMRRLLPLTNQKMNWDQTVHKLIANLKK